MMADCQQETMLVWACRVAGADSYRAAVRYARVAALLLGALTARLGAQQSAAPGAIDGLVTDDRLVAIADATASILGSNIRVVTGANGRFRMTGLVARSYVVVVQKLGYAPLSTVVQVAEGDTLRPAFALERNATMLDTVVVSGRRPNMRMAEFEERRRYGLGQFMTEVEIEKRNSVFASDLLRTFLGVTLAGGHAINPRASYPGRECPYQFFIDGVKIPTPGLDTELPTPKDLAGIEVFSSIASVPLQYKTFSGGGFCGVILLWTRGG